ncbi:MAG: hypothetical protein ACOX4U_00480 [Anaerovoracaceae bacterium]|jgi:hypothetical protein
MAIKISIDALGSTIDNIIKGYEKKVYEATDEGLDKGAALLKEVLGEASPRKTGGFAKSWNVEKLTGLRLIHNTKIVYGKGKPIPLVDILEYSTTRGKPFVKRTYNAKRREIANIIIENLKKT